jgi:hypothetical protein
MSTSIIQSEPLIAVGSLADGDELLVSDASAGGAASSTTMLSMRQYISGGVTDATAATLTVTAASHAGQTITLNRAAGVAVTLPAASGTGNRYTFVVGTTFTSDGTIKVVTDDIMVGTALLFADGGDTTVGFATAADSDTITLTGTTTGGIAGAVIRLQDIAADTWHVEMVSDASGTEATPFSATVS